jgi:hypothetical protein
VRDVPFSGEKRDAMEARIRNVCAHPMDVTIARMRILDHELWSDIGAEVGCDRRTASRRFDKIKDLI